MRVFAFIGVMLIGKQLFPAGVVKRRRRERSLTATGLMIVATEFALRRELPVTALRKRVYQTMLRESAAHGQIAAGDTVTVNVEAPLARTSQALEQFRRLMALVEVNPEIQRGEPVLRGTRVTVSSIAAITEGGSSIAEILRHYPSLTAEQVARRPASMPKPIPVAVAPRYQKPERSC